MTAGSFYKELNITNTEFTDSPTVKFDSIASKVTIVNDSLLNDIEYSYNGRDVEGKLKWSDELIRLGGMTISKLWLKASVNSGTEVRVWARL